MLYVFRKHSRRALLFCASTINFPFLTPNRLTLLSIPFSLIAAYYISIAYFPIAVVFILLSFFIDALDGALAEIREQKSPFGNYLDAVVDRVTEAIIFFGFLFLYPVGAAFTFSTGILASYSKARLGAGVEADNRDWSSLGDRADRAIMLLAGMSAAIFFPFFFGHSTMELALYLIAVAAFVGNIQRLLFARELIGIYERKRGSKKND